MAKVNIENGISLYYEEEGRGEAVALVQGLDRDHTGMRFQRKELAKHFRVISYDARGTGLSDTPPGPYTCLQMADDLAYLLRALGIAKAYVIGASMGGAIAQEFAIKYPQMADRLVLLCTFMKADAFVQQLAKFWMQAVEKTGHVLLCEGILPWLYTREFFENQQLALDWARKLIREQEPLYSIRGFQWKAQAALAADMTDRIHLIKAPTLVVAGELDLVVPPALCQKLADAIKGARFTIINGGGHALFDEKPFVLNEVLLDFLKEDKQQKL